MIIQTTVEEEKGFPQISHDRQRNELPAHEKEGEAGIADDG